MTDKRQQLLEAFQDEESRYAYAEGFLDSIIATQIKVIREQRGFTQAQLAQRMGVQLSRVSELEDVNYTAWKVTTLQKLARALDVRLKITFETFETLPDELLAYSRESLERPGFGDLEK